MDFTKRGICLGMILLMTSTAYAWNNLGHRLVGQIACDNLTPQAMVLFNGYNRLVDSANRQYGPRSLVNSAAWLDSLRRPDQLWMQSMHYINIPYTRDGTPVNPPKTLNAVSAIEQARLSLENLRGSDYDKGFNVRVLLHVVGDIHQPMHSISLFSPRFRNGDKGGNLFRLKANPVADNLHAYWDRGGGYLIKKKRYTSTMLRRRAKQIEKRWPCDTASAILSPQAWANESFQLAVDQAYQLKYGQKPSSIYQKQVKQTSEQRIALAGCRLAALLNHTAGIMISKRR